MRARRPPALLPIFRSEEQARLLSLLFLAPNGGRTLQQLTGGHVSRATTERELSALVKAGILTAEPVGRTRLFKAAEDSPIYEPLRELLERTLGVEPRLREALQDIPGVQAAAIYGSWAAGEVGPSSDIDVLVIGTVDHSAVARSLMPVGEAVGREMNVTSITPGELTNRLGAGDPFLEAVLAGALMPLVGDVADLVDG